jgi:transcriptional regulator with XRE-family HTH domain
MTIGNKVSGRLKELDRSQRWLARQAGVSPATISLIVNGGGTSDSTAMAIARSLEVPIDWLLDESRDEPHGSLPQYGFPLVEDFPDVAALRQCIIRGGGAHDVGAFDRLCSDLAFRLLLELDDCFRRKSALDLLVQTAEGLSEGQRHYGVSLQDKLVDISRKMNSLGAANIVPETARMNIAYYQKVYGTGAYFLGTVIAGMSETEARAMVATPSLDLPASVHSELAGEDVGKGKTRAATRGKRKG